MRGKGKGTINYSFVFGLLGSVCALAWAAPKNNERGQLVGGSMHVSAGSEIARIGEPPINDECTGAIDVGPLPATVNGDSTAALSDLDFPCGPNVDGPFRNVWYSVVGTGGTFTATTCSPNTDITDTEISIFCADCDNLICVDGNDDSCLIASSTLSTVSWCTELNRTYFITLGGADNSTNTGLFELQVTDAADVCEFPIDCNVITGACCSLGVCTETTLPDACDGEFYPGESCPDFVCPSGCPCDDGLFCNGMETCDQFNNCIPGIPVDCSHLTDACNVGVCDEASDSCVAQPVANGSVCEDGMFCTAGDACVDGQCVGVPQDCNDNNSCTEDFCDEAADICINTPNNVLCDDGQFCNGLEFCDPILGCQPGTPVICPPAEICNVSFCDEVSDMCVIVPGPDNEPCDDGQFCSVGDRCIGGACQPGTPVTCPPAEACNLSFCDEISDMCATAPGPDNEPCDDGQFCSVGDLCVGGSCQPGTPRDCGDMIPCTNDVCREDLDLCEHVANNNQCEDGNVCTNDVCDLNGGCQFPDNGLCGACCNTITGQCVDHVLASSCTGFNMVFTQGATCAQVNCTPAVGACCDRANNSCSITTQAQCNCSGCTWIQGVDCSQVDCDTVFTPIPTVSQWGMVVLALILLCGAKIAFTRREQSA